MLNLLFAHYTIIKQIADIIYYTFFFFNINNPIMRNLFDFKYKIKY